MIFGFIAGVIAGFLGNVYRDNILTAARALWNRLLRRS
jgi:hypothetical protein